MRINRETVIKKEISKRTIKNDDGPDWEEVEYLITVSPSYGKIVVSEKRYEVINADDIIYTVYRGDNKGIADFYQEKLYEITD